MIRLYKEKFEMFKAQKRKTLSISLPSSLYKELERLANENAIGKGDLIRKIIHQYIETAKSWKEIRKWGDESALELGIKEPDEVERLVEAYRKEMSDDPDGGR
jgi:metal-responsive CopG/Arc/MetJ family transcriptional regulator